MENLNKENLWNALSSKYPDAVETFCQWIDKYKKEVDWTTLFSTYYINDVKFHDIPFDMQVGIMIRFFHEIGLGYLEFNHEEFSQTVRNFFGLIERNPTKYALARD